MNSVNKILLSDAFLDVNVNVVRFCLLCLQPRARDFGGASYDKKTLSNDVRAVQLIQTNNIVFYPVLRR